MVISALSSYVAAVTNTIVSWSSGYVLTASEIDEFVSSISNRSIALNSNTSFLVTQSLTQTTSNLFGAYYIHNVGGGIVNSIKENNVMNPSVTAAAILSSESLMNATFVRIFIIDEPTTYKNIDVSNNKMLASSVIVVSVERNSFASTPMNISLYFRVSDGYRPVIDGIYSCAFYHLNSAQWNESGCTKPVYNILLDRYECSCNHLSTFALVWSPNRTSCNAFAQLSLPNGTCMSKTDAQV